MVQFEGGRNRWCEAVSKGRSIVFLDTTHGTNKFGYHLGFWLIITATGVTSPIAYSLQRLQKTEYFADLYAKFESIFGVQPEVICTDRDAAMCSALAVWPSCKQMVCVWHLSQNFEGQLNKLRVSGRRKIMKFFWSIVKEHDWSFRSKLEESLVKLRDMALKNSRCSQSAAAKKIRDGFQTWMDVLWSTRCKWATCYTARHFCGGTMTTGTFSLSLYLTSQFMLTSQSFNTNNTNQFNQ